MPMTQDELTSKVNLILDLDKEEKNDAEKVEENYFNKKFQLIKPKKVKIHKVTFIKKVNKEKEEIKDEKFYMKRKLILPKINKENTVLKNYESSLINDNEKVKEKEELKKDKIKILSKNKSQINMLKHPNISSDSIWKKNIFSNKINNRNKIGLNKELSKSDNSLTNIFQNKINSLNAKIMNSSQVNEASIPEYNFVKKDKQLFDNIINKLAHKENVYSYLEKNFVLFNIAENSKYKSANKRKEYSENKSF